MRSARKSAIRLLQLMMVASIVLPASLFSFAAWLSYRHTYELADDRIERSLDIVHEHALKVFQTVERAIAEIDEVLRGLSDDDIRAQEQRLHERFRQIVAALPQIQAIVVVDREGRRQVASMLYPVPRDPTVSDRSFFRAHVDANVGTYVSEVLVPRSPAIGKNFFNLSRRRTAADGSFNGVTAVAVLPGYFEEFYHRIGRTPGNLYAMTREDGVIIARYPVRNSPTQNLDSSAALLREIGKGLEQGLYTVQSQIDHLDRRTGYRKMTGFPVYVTAGTETSAIRAEWLTAMTSHLIFGLPATFLLFAIIGLALERTRRLYVEAERRETAEAALRQAQRLEAIGQMTGGVAHDFNNLLMIVSGSVQRLRRELSAEKHVRLLDMIMTATQRGESLTRQLLTFSRRQTLTPAVIDLTRWLPELKEMLSRSLRGDIETEVVAPRRSCAVKVDASELELALLNLAVNARDAMPSGGSLHITAKPVVLRGHAAEEGLRGEFVAIRVADNGVGIPAEALPHVFEPFFTTKEVGKGTGLGLSQVYGFARQSGGTVTVTSTVGRGTVITLYLPLTREAPAEAVVQPEADVAPQQTGTVLLVEDNDEVAEVCNAYFQQLGYGVKRAAGAQEALEFLENEGPVDLVFSDILMPGVMNGLALAHAIRDRFPGMPVLLATGYSSSAQDAVREGFVVLQKPFELAALEASLREALRGKQPPGEVRKERAVG
ncbi:MAG: two-component system, NtrC family, sensor kinase [Alphaproteobacteria bacterium]|nr:two-component system, NtrC family, sensor kinase [Alphaproteobacteria bacterium]